MTINRNGNPELVAECRRLIEEIQGIIKDGDLNQWEKEFINGLDNRITQFGDGTYISENQKKKLDEIYERVC